MTVETATSRVSYTGAGTTGPFTIPFYFIANADIAATKVLISDGTETALALTTDYTLSGAGESAGGTLTLVASLSSSYRLVIYRDPEDLQETAYPKNDPFPAESHEDALDRRTMVSLRHGDLLSRSLRQPDGDSTNISSLPAKVTRASKYLSFNADGDPVASSGTGTDTGLREDLASLTDPAVGAALVGMLKPATGVVARSVFETSKRQYDIYDFKTAASGSDWLDAFTRAQASGEMKILVPRGTYGLSDKFVLTASMNFVGDGYYTSGSVITALGGYTATSIIEINGSHQSFQDIRVLGAANADCFNIIAGDYLNLVRVWAKGASTAGYAGYRLQKGNIMRWWDVFAETTDTGFLAIPSSNDLNGGLYMGLRSYASAAWAFDLQANGTYGMSNNTFEASAEQCTPGGAFRIRKGLYNKFNLYTDGTIDGAEFDFDTNANEYFLRDATGGNASPALGGTAGTGYGAHGTGSNLYLYPGQVGPNVFPTYDVDATIQAAGQLQIADVGTNYYNITNSNNNATPINLEMGFLATCRIGFPVTIFKADNTKGLYLRKSGFTFPIDTTAGGLFGDAASAAAPAAVQVIKLSTTTAVIKAL